MQLNYLVKVWKFYPPIHFRKTAAYDIVEWVEYYRLMGVDYFMIYNYTSDSLTDKS